VSRSAPSSAESREGGLSRGHQSLITSDTSGYFYTEEAPSIPSGDRVSLRMGVSKLGIEQVAVDVKAVAIDPVEPTPTESEPKPTTRNGALARDRYGEDSGRFSGSSLVRGCLQKAEDARYEITHLFSRLRGAPGSRDLGGRFAQQSEQDASDVFR
jgi:hypothetical protein